MRRHDTTVIISKGGVFEAEIEYPGFYILAAVNRLAQATGRQKISAPSVNDIRKEIEQARRKKGK